MQRCAAAAVVVALWTGGAHGQMASPDPGADTATGYQAVESSSEKEWLFSPSIWGFVVPDDADCIQLTVGASYKHQYFEVRYNYEALETGSLWFGYIFETGGEFWLEFTPMLGGVFGDLGALAPGYNVSLGYRKLDLYSEAEYVIDLEEREENFLYSWSELAFSPTDQFRFGFVVQRTRAYESDLEIERGILAGCLVKRWEITGYLFNLGWEDPTLVLSFATEF